jgi:hypothetical protein
MNEAETRAKHVDPALKVAEKQIQFSRMDI